MFTFLRKTSKLGQIAMASFRVGMVLILLLGACGPAKPAGQTPASQTGEEQADNVTPFALEPQYYDAPAVEVPERTSPEADDVAVSLPPEHVVQPVEFQLAVSPSVVEVGNELTFLVTVRNNTEQELTNLAFVDQLETGLVFVSSANGVKVSEGTVSYKIDAIPGHDFAQFEYKVKVDAFNAKYKNGELWLHSVDLTGAGGVDLAAQAAFGVEAGIDGDTFLAAVPEEGGWVSAGETAVYLPDGAVKQDSVLVVSPEVSGENDPDVKFELSMLETGEIATDESGNVVEQRVALDGARKAEFDEPVFLEVNFDAIIDLNEIPAGQEPFIATYYEEYDIWVKVPVLDVDYGNNTALVQTTHFSTWGAGLGASLPQNGTGALLFDQPYVSLFTGAAQYSVPIWMPSGRAGMTPSVSLSYSSGTMNGVLGDVQSPWVGEGWNIDSAEIVRKITTSSSGYGYENSFALTLNGAMYPLIRDEYHPSRYYVTQNAFLYIELHNKALGNAGNVANETGEWWEVVTTDGTRYRLGWKDDSEQLALMYGYSCTLGGDHCLTPNGPYASLGYAGTAVNLVARRWRVDRVTDTYGNYMEYSYAETQPAQSSNIEPFDRSSYLETISYTGFDTEGTANDLQPGYQVRFVLADRSQVGDVPTQYNVWDIVDMQYLDRIEICYGACGATGSTTIRTYDLGYTLAAAPNSNGTLTLTSLAISGGGFTENGISIPATQSATVRFNYQNMANRAVSGSTDPFNYPRLVSIENGYGGKLTYTYETDGRGTDSWYNYRVQKAEVSSGLGLAVARSYTYATPVYSGIGANSYLGELIGYTTVTENSLDFNNSNSILSSTVHQYGTTGLDVGREYSAEVSSSGVVYQKTVNSYVTDNSQATSPYWNYRYLAQIENYTRSNGSLVLVSKTQYYNDPATGNLLVQSDYLGTSLYRKIYHEYLANPDPDVYILGAVSRTLLVDANNQVYSDTYYHYDGSIGTPPVHGKVTLTQARTGSGTQTVDSAAEYDVYGNAMASIVYDGYGTVNAAPTANAIESNAEYDDVVHTYPVETANALNYSTTTTYLYTLGVAYQTTDINGWPTTTTYDGLGRTLSVTAPGLNQPGVLYSYPSPNANGQVAAPYAIEMQILDLTASAYRSVWGIYDGLGRVLQNQVYDADQGQLLLTDVSFNAQGQTSRQSLSHYASGNGGTYITPNWSALTYTSSAYDGLGRQISTTAPGNLTSQTAYDGLTTTVTDPNGNLRKQIADGLGRLVQVQEYQGTAVYATTQYAYDEANRLVQVTDAVQNVTSLEYNWLGQKTSMDDPDMGAWYYSYDSRGNLVGQEDARGEELTFTYDTLNRMTNKYDGNTLLASYSYGTTTGTLGMRISMSDASGSASWTYDNYGRTVSETRTMDSLTNTTTTVSDWLGRVLSTTYPNEETVYYSYDALGRPVDLTSSEVADTTLAELAYDQLGRITTLSLGNGVVDVTNAYDSALRLDSRQAVNSNNETLVDFDYEYDNNGNITQITDSVLDEVHYYDYDGLNRLLFAQGKNSDDSSDIYTQNFYYDKVGNILQVNSLELMGFDASQGMDVAAALSGMEQEDTSSVLYRYQPRSFDEEITDTPTATDTATDTATITPTPSATFTPTDTRTPLPTITRHWTNTPSNTVTPVNSLTPTRTNTPTRTSTFTQTPSSTLTYTKTPTANVGSGLVLYWSFNNVGATIPDDSGHGYVGGMINGASSVPYGRSGAAMQFDGINDSVSTTDAYSATNPTGSFSLSVWIYPAAEPVEPTSTPSSTPTSTKTPVVENTPLIQVSGSYSLAIASDNCLSFTIYGLTPSKITGPQLPAGEWSLVQAVYDNSAKQVSLYVNGVLASSATTTGSVYATNQRFYLSPGGNRYFKGLMDEVRLYSRALTSDEIQGLYGFTASTEVPTISPTITPTPTNTATSTHTPVGFTPTVATPTPTSIRPDDLPYGTGLDGDVTVTGTVNLNTTSLAAGRTCADAVAYSVVQLYGNVAILNEAPAAGCLAQNDEILLINLQGTDVYYNTGKYEFLRVASVNGKTVTFTTSIVQWFGGGASDDTNIGVGTWQQRVMIQRVPNYDDITINGTLTANPYTNYLYGVIAFRSSGTLSGSGTISADAIGFAGGRGCGGGGIEQKDGQSYNFVLGVGGAGLAGPNYTTTAVGAGSGGYSTTGTQGVNGGSAGGRSYGNPELSRIYLGSGGGGEGCGTSSTGGAGGNGGGAIFVAAETIDFAGQINSRGATGSGNRPAGGSGGSIRIEGETITLNTFSVAGGVGSGTPEPGATGRVAIYYSQSYSASSTPGYLRQTGLPATSTPLPTPVVLDVSPYGDGKNGDLTIGAGETFNIHTQTRSLTFQCADGGDAVTYKVTSLTSSSATLSSTPASGCLKPGDEVMLMNVHGTVNTGTYEFLRVGGVSGNTVSFTTSKVNFYGANATDDTGIGLSGAMVIIQRVPNYEDVTVNGTLTGSPFELTVGQGARYGFIVFRVQGTLSGSGTINGNAIGYPGGRGCQGSGAEARNGMSYDWQVGSNGSGLAGPDYTIYPKGAGSGGYRTAGVRGYDNGAAGGLAYGSANLEKLYLGSGGGGEGCASGNPGGNGGNGGGAIFILARTITFSGQINAQGAAGTGGRPAGGSGGSIRIEGDEVTLNTSSVTGGSGGTYGATGSSGRVSIYYSNSFTANFTPGYLLNTTTGLVDSISSDDFEAGLSAWVTPVPENANVTTSVESAYWGANGLQVTIASNDALYIQDDAPSAEGSYRARVYFNLDGLTGMATNDLFTLFSGQAGANNSFEVQVQKTATARQVRLVVYKDGGTTVTTSWYDLTSGWHALEVQFKAAGAENASDGTASLWLDGVQKQALTAIDNDTLAIDSARLGANGVDTGTRGVIYFDDFDSRRFSAIGLLPDPGTDTSAPASQYGFEEASYSYADDDHVHAVTSVDRGATTDTYAYDASGNMTCRVEDGKTYNQVYNAENRMTVAQLLRTGVDCPAANSLALTSNTLASWQFVYDGDGTRVKQVYTEYDENGDPTSALSTYLFAGGTYEVQVGAQTTVKMYYAIAGRAVAMRTVTDGGSELNYFLTDHLGSVVAVTDASGALVSEQRYLPFGEVRQDVGSAITQTDFGFTGQRALDAQGTVYMLGLMDYKARFFDPYTNRFTQPDTIVPDSRDTQAFNRYSYVLNNPVLFRDPSGHCTQSGYSDGVISDSECENMPDSTSNNQITNTIFNPTVLNTDLLTSSAKKLYAYYLDLYNSRDGWWWEYYGSDGNFTLDEFMSMIYAYEISAFAADDHNSIAVPMYVEAYSRYIHTYCSELTRTTGISCNPYTFEGQLNYLGETHSAWNHYTAGIAGTNDMTIDAKMAGKLTVAAIRTPALVGHPEWAEGFAKDRPYNAGNETMLTVDGAKYVNEYHQYLYRIPGTNPAYIFSGCQFFYYNAYNVSEGMQPNFASFYGHGCTLP